jgi:C4-dicarboxylate-specific signal transduction histidine kinase
MKYNQQFEEIIQKLLPLIEIGSSPETLEKDILTLIDIYKKKDRRLNRIIKLSDKQQRAILELNEELDSYKQNLEERVTEEIQKRKNQEALLFEQSRLAAIAEMIDAAAHQWMQPLNILSIQISMLPIKAEKSNGLSPEEVRKFQQDASLQITHMTDTLSNFRTFFKPMSDARSFSVYKTVQSTLRLVQNELDRYSITSHLQCDEDFQILGNENEFKHILLNLINNARYAFMQKEVAQRHITLHISGKEKKIEIIDNAGGIDEKIMPNLFRAGCTTKGEKGSGMGLYMSAQIAKKHNGQLLAENSAEGAKFTFILKEDA